MIGRRSGHADFCRHVVRRLDQESYQAPKMPTLAGVMAGLDQAIGYPHQFANDAIPVSNHRARMAGTSQVKLGHDGVGRCLWCVNS